MKKIRLFCFPYVGTTAPMLNQWKGWRLTEQLDSHSHSGGIRLNVQTHGGELYSKNKKINYLKFKFFTKEVKMFRFDVKKVILTFLLGMMMSVFPYALWSQNLEIHYINVQQGQSTLIIGPNGTTILYDGGDEFKGTTEVVPYLQSLGIMTSQPLDYMIASHRDADHYTGLTEVINYGYDALNVYDNGSDKYNTYIQEFLDAAATTTAGGVVPMPMGYVIDLGNGATATCVAVNGSVIGFGAVPDAQANENDRAICLLIQYGDFDYLVTGDIGGGADDYACTGRSTSQANIETPLVQAIMPGGTNPMLSQYGVELAHVSHHGSESSTNSDYMNALTPTVACISVGDGQGSNWFHPRIDVVEHVLLAQGPCITAPPALVLQTEEGAPTGETTSFAGYCVGDIVIITDGVNSYNISATGAVSQGPDERTAAGLPATYYFDEYIGADPAPMLFNIHEDNVGETSADIIWSTNEPATSVVRYGTVSGTYPNTVSDSTQELNHQLTLTGLAVATTYYYVVESTDATSNITTSDEHSFTTGGTPLPKVLFSEIYYDTVGTDSVEEWIELYNDSTETVDLSGWTITDNNGSGATFTIPDGTTIKSGTYLTIAADSAGFNALYGYDADVYGSIPGLNNTGDALILKDNLGHEVDAVGWEGGASGGVPDGWGSSSDPNAPTGSTIVRTPSFTDTDTYMDWSVAPNNGNPQTQPTSFTNVVFSEIFYDTPGNENIEEWIEIYNNTPDSVDLSGWTITDNNGTGYTFTFPAGATIAAGTYYTVARDSAGFNALYGYDADHYANLPYLNNDGDALILYDSSHNEIDAVAWEGGASAGIPDGWGSTSDPWASAGHTIVRTDPTVDTDTYADWGYATNNGNPQTQLPPPIPKVVFSEVFYDTPGIDSEEEWIELYNNSPTTVDIEGWTIIDNNGTGWTYTFPAGTTIAAGTYLTVAMDSAGFTAIYGYEADLYGSLPYLNNDGDALILYDNSSNEVDAVAWEGGASAGIPDGWGSTSDPWASTGNTIVRIDPTVDTDSYTDWTYATNNGNPQTQYTPGNILISEVFYDTPGDENTEEWFELYNNSTFTVNIGGWYVIDNNGTGATFVIPDGETMEPGTFYTIAKSSTGFVALYGYEADTYGNIPPLNNTGDTLILYDPIGNVKDFVAWEGGAGAGIPDGWGSTSNPWAYEGNSIVRIDATVDTDTYADWTWAPDNGYPQTQAMGVPDITPPVISNVQAGSITIDSAVIEWETDEPADSVVEYGTSPGNYTDTLDDPAPVTSHSIALSNLTPATTYYYRVASTDESGNTAVSDEYTFTTLAIMVNTISMSKYKKANDVHADALITVTSDGAPVEGAVVDVTWSGDYYTGTDQGVTDANGEVTFRSGPTHPNKWSFTITVDNITKEGYYWDAANSETTETINKHKHKDD
jgi:beta-lactamase superfamily II metal-dependent hydrolase